MSKFYASVSNNRSTITKCGHKDGLSAHIRGWNKGIEVNVSFNEETKKEIFEVYETSGSNGKGNKKLVFEVEE